MRRPAHHPLAAALLLAIHLAACTSWHVEQASPQALLDAQHPSRLRVTRRDGARIVLAHPSMVGDTLVGGSQGHSPRVTPAQTTLAHSSLLGDTPVGAARGRSTRVAVADIASLAVRRGSAPRTLLLIGGIILVTAGASAAMENSMDSMNMGVGGGLDWCLSCGM